MMRNHEASRKPPLFDDTNFGFWKKRMNYYLMSLGPEVWHFILNEYQIPATLPTDQEERKAYIANAKALNSITSGITDSEFTKVMNCNSAKEMWDKLVGLYDGDSKVKKTKLQTHRRQFERLDEKIEESIVVEKVLRSLPNRFDSKISAIKEAKDLDALKMDELHGIPTSYEMRKGGPSFKDAAFKALKSKKGKERNDYSDDSDVEYELAQFVRKLKKGSKLKGKYPLIYFKCGKIGHYVAKCPHKHDTDDEGNSKRKVENEETRRREDLSETKLKEKEETCEECEVKIVSLRKELEQVKKGWKSSQILETILKSQKPQHDKSGIGFKGESSSTKNSAKSYADALSSNPKEEKVCHQKRIPDPNNEERITPKKNVDLNHGYYNKYKPVFHQRPISNPKNEVGIIPRKETPKLKDQIIKPYGPKR
eukprot:PITA_20580